MAGTDPESFTYGKKESRLEICAFAVWVWRPASGAPVRNAGKGSQSLLCLPEALWYHGTVPYTNYVLGAQVETIIMVAARLGDPRLARRPKASSAG